jgi:putative acetyltransferase
MKNLDIKIKTAKSTEDFFEGKKIIIEYANWLGIDLSFQNFDDELNRLQEMYSEPTGGLILASIDNKVIGVAGIRKFESKDCELKRMYVNNEYRNLGIGKILLESAIELAKKLHYNKLKLDTLGFMKSAIKLYEAYGFMEIPPYRYNIIESAKYFELKLKT